MAWTKISPISSSWIPVGSAGGDWTLVEASAVNKDWFVYGWFESGWFIGYSIWEEISQVSTTWTDISPVLTIWTEV